MFGGAHQSRSGAVERGAAVGEGHEVGGFPAARGIGEHHELDADLTLRIVEPEPARAVELGECPVDAYHGRVGSQAARSSVLPGFMVVL